VIDEARQFPFMGEKRVVIVKEAQEMKTLKDMVDYFKKPVPHAVVVFAHKFKNFDKRTAAGKALDAHILFEAKKIYDNQLPAWILKYAKDNDIGIDERLSQILAEYLGNDLKKVANELNKLALANGKGTKLTLEIIQEQIGISKEFSVFELQKALSSRDRYKSFLIAKYMGENQKENPIQLIVSSLYGYFLKVLLTLQNIREGDQILMKKLGLTTSFFVKDYKAAAKNFDVDKLRDILLAIRRVDLESKGVFNKSKSDEELLKELVYDILS
jgi:DNA polymerase-3 subunit delta